MTQPKNMKTRHQFLAFSAGLGCFLASLAQAQISQTVTWNGGDSFGSYGDSNNWTPRVVPLNNPGTNFTVIVPVSTSLMADNLGEGQIEALNFGASRLRLRGTNTLLVTGPAVIEGLIDAQGSNAAFLALSGMTVLQDYPRLWSGDGAKIVATASSYSFGYANCNDTLLSAIGDGSRVELTNATTLTVSYGDNGSWVYSVTVKSNGVIDLRRLGQITGAGQDDWLDFNIESGGNLLVPSLARVARDSISALPTTKYRLWSKRRTPTSILTQAQRCACRHYVPLVAPPST
jgi:hypothetical protein